jgi:hypothetical protein
MEKSYTRIYVEMDLKRGHLEEICLEVIRCLGIERLIMNMLHSSVDRALLIGI